MRHDHRYVWLDFIRGACAIAVCASHLRGVSIVDYANLGPASALQKAFYVVTGFGHQAVMVFFVLSGFFVGGAVLKHREQFDALRYITARLTRLWLVLIPALCLTALVDAVLVSQAPNVLSGAYRGLWNSGPGPDLPYSASWPTFVANVFFLQTVTAPVFGTNGPLWSLSNEFWYYALFPMVLLSLRGRTKGGPVSALVRCGLAAACVGLIAWLPTSMTEDFAIWLSGLLVFAAAGKTSGRLNRLLLVAGALAFAAALSYSRSPALQHAVGVSADFAIGAAFCVLAVGIVNGGTQATSPGLFTAVATAISNFSFSLYLVHFPCVALIGALFYGGEKLRPNAVGLSLFAAWLVALLAFGYLFYALFERRTDAVRRKTEQLLGLGPRTA